MNFSPAQWRAGSGYLPNPNQPTPLCTSYPTFTSPPLQPGYAHHLYYPSSGQICAIPPPPPPQPKKEEKKSNKDVLPPAKPASTVVAAASTTTTSKTLVTPSTCTCTTTWNPALAGWVTICKCCPDKPADEAKKPAEEVKKPATPTMSTLSPPSLRPGENYMFPPDHTMLHVFNKAAPIWESKYHGLGLAFKMFKVATTFTVDNVIERVLKKKKGEECEGWCATEVVEMGEGCWVKGTSVKYGGEKGKGSLAAMGWGGKRGKELPPVWVVVHKD